jgi:hypothetical protein
MKSLTFQVPEELWDTFEEIAAREGQSAEAVMLEWLTKHAPKRRNLTPEEAERARQQFRRWFGSVASGNPRSADNEQIDADLAREYGNSHEE